MSERERFEKWAISIGWDLERLSHGGYGDVLAFAGWKAWQAALSTRKTWGYTIVDKDFATRHCANQEKRNIEDLCEFFNKSEASEFESCAPFRTVPLFYEDQS